MKTLCALAALVATTPVAAGPPLPYRAVAAAAPGPSTCARIAPFVAEIWPLIAKPGDLIVDAVLPLPPDTSAMGHQPGPTLPPVDAASPFWREGWVDRERPSAALVNAWLAVQGGNVAACLRSSGGPARVIDQQEQQRLIQDWNDSSGVRAFTLGPPAFDATQSRALMHVSTTCARLCGEDFLILFGKAGGRWRMLARQTISAS